MLCLAGASFVRSRLDRCQKINIGAFIICKMQMERARFSGETATGNRERRGRKKAALNLLIFFCASLKDFYPIIFPSQFKQKQASSFTTLVIQQQLVDNADEPSV